MTLSRVRQCGRTSPKLQTNAERICRCPNGRDGHVHHNGCCFADVSELAETRCCDQCHIAGVPKAKQTTIQQEGETVTIIKVAEHKMGLLGSTKLILPPADLSKLHTYVTTIRPSQDPNGSSAFLLCLTGRKQLANFNSRFKTLAKHYALTPLTATSV